MSQKIINPSQKTAEQMKFTWPRIRLSAIFGVVSDEEEKQENRTALWVASYQYLIKWYLNFQRFLAIQLKPFYAHPSRSLNDYDLFMDQLEADQRSKAMALLMYQDHKRFFAFQGAICAERTAGQISLLSHFFSAVANLFKNNDVTLTTEQESILWAGLTNTGSYHDFPIEEMGLVYQEPTLPEDLLPEYHAHALEYHRNVVGSVAAMLHTNSLRPHPESQPVVDAQRLFDDASEFGLGVIYGLLQLQMIAQQKQEQLRAMAIEASHGDVSWLKSFDHTWDQAPDLFTSPLVGVAPFAPHRFAAFNGGFSKNSTRMSSEQWCIYIRQESARFPIYQSEQSQIAETLEVEVQRPEKRRKITPLTLRLKL
jgi:hypothetical protein